MLNQSFEYFVPKNLPDALSLLKKYGKECKVVAGGTDLTVLLKDRELSPNYLADISLVKELDYIKEDKNSIKIGPLATHRALSESPLIASGAVVLNEACKRIGTTQIRNMGTIGGNIVNASPCADAALAVVSMSADLTLSDSSNGQRTVPADEFFVHVNKTILRSDELLTAISIPKMTNNCGGAFMKLGRRVGRDLSIVSAGSTVTLQGNTCESIRLAFGSVAPTPIRARKAEGFLVGKMLTEDNVDEASEMASREIKPITDIRASEQYRRTVARYLARRCILAAVNMVGA